MADSRDFAVRPRAEFEHRLEQALLDELFPQDSPHARPGAHSKHRLETMIMTTLEQNPDTDTRTARRWWLAAAGVLILVGGIFALNVTRDDSTPLAESPSDDISPAAGTAVNFDTQWPSLGASKSQSCIETSTVYEWAEGAGRCIRTFEGEATLTGDITGTALWAMLANQGTAADENDARADITATFNGTYLVKAEVAGCGSGEFMIAEQLRFLGWESGQFAGTWQIVPGSGRGELSSITGSGTMPAADTDTTRAHTGTISCG
ncbi:MAG TPA: DUF3224 domain-containing protein [Ilumatobacteraceae bacterium]|jgi:hypothetical protein|nr:DUF3224 domain-containing protein [Ilumatobacteraceae bacterium]